MDDAMTEKYLMEETKDSNALAPTEVDSKKACEHDTRLDEQIGIYCLKCGDVITEIRDVMGPFIQPRRGRRYQEVEKCNGDSKPELEPKDKDMEDNDSHAITINTSHYESLSTENDSVWSLIPELSKKMHDHQKKGFQFIWQNIVGSIQPSLMEVESERRGGCVISHTPGAGKTFLVIAFLVSYLKLFPDKKPLILAPKTTLYTWYKEFIKWEIPIPVYLILDRKNKRDFDETPLSIPGVPNPTSDVKHVLDCLEKIKKWHLHPSVLVMGYTSFLSLTRENSKYEHKTYMAKALRESTGILILDEGHNPRSTRSRLRKGLMKVETELRILLSGTLFQNNFGEYFNTLCLARPKFVHEVLKELDIKQKKGNDKNPEKTQHLLETRARKFFLDDIANKIDSSDDEVRMQGLNMLRKITSCFIDVYESGNSDKLPGLQIYTLLMNLTDVQNELLQKLQKKMVGSSVFPLEGELMVTLGSIHPWLIKTATSANKFYTSQELNQLEKFKFDFRVGSKVRFILNLIFRVVKEEKVLIFCRNLAPMKILVQLFEECFKWKKDGEILLLYGEQDPFERGKVIDKFEDPCGVSKVLLASITACSEGISLTAASRLIFLDSEWNPSKIKQAIARAFRPGQEKDGLCVSTLGKRLNGGR
ncbi:SNF2-related, N-terminal domain [Sesbania bispinosa]|nr:SNF2-related, N-terminal domain [Sesbania bispinosa]